MSQHISLVRQSLLATVSLSHYLIERGLEVQPSPPADIFWTISVGFLIEAEALSASKFPGVF